jgi:hypothetical protein
LAEDGTDQIDSGFGSGHASMARSDQGSAALPSSLDLRKIATPSGRDRVHSRLGQGLLQSANIEPDSSGMVRARFMFLPCPS